MGATLALNRLSTSQRQAIIKIIEIRVIQNWTHISLLNVELKIISKAFSENIKQSCTRSNFGIKNSVC